MSTSVPAVYYRGGTSKAPFFHEKDIPAPGPLRDAFLKRVIGTPDPLQIDGMGGTHITTSKIAIISPSKRDGVDVDYTFVQLGIADDFVNYSGNCGNISSAVGPFAISEGLVKTNRKGASIVEGLETREVRVFNTGTQKVLVTHVPVDTKTGEVVEEGDFAITGVPGTGAPLLMDYSNTIGASRNKGLLPTGNIRDTIELSGTQVEITICDVANLIVMIDSQAVGVSCSESAKEISANSTVIAACKEVRGKAAQILGMCQDWRLVDEQAPMLPMVMLVAPDDRGDGGDICARLIIDNACHDSMAGTGATCLTACSHVPGTIPYEKLHPRAAEKEVFNISHPIGLMPVSVVVDKVGESGNISFRSLSFVRTARRIMTGVVHVPASLGFKHDSKKTAKDVTGPLSNIPVTRKFAEFITVIGYEKLTTDVVEKLKMFVMDNIGVTARAAGIGESSSSFLTAIASMANSSGQSTVISKGQGYSMEYAALLNAAFSHTFDFDDTFAAGASHPGASLISTALAYGEANGATGKDILLALAIGYEISCRLARALGTGAYARGFHNTATAGIFGSIAVLAKLKSLSTDVVETAFGLAGSKAAGSMQFLDNGAWNKRLHPGFAARDAFLCVALAESGVRGSSRPIEGTYGLLHNYSVSSSANGLVEELGNQWVFLSTALKPFPACRMTHAPLELAAELSHATTASVQSIEVHLSPSCWAIVGKPEPNKRHPVSIVDAQFSVYFQVANAWLHGAYTGWDAYQHIADADITALLNHIRCLPDTELPDLAGRIDVTWQDGTHKSLTLIHPLGEEERPFTMDKVLAKFNSLAEPVYGTEGSKQIVQVLRSFEQLKIVDLMNLLK